MFFTAEFVIGLLLSAFTPFLAYKVSSFLHEKSDPPWKKKE
ncbi:hypothetical protein [Cohnella sp. JJ-181]|nr:hypothetical protein [Cohnella sp. JJ-181]CAI6047786.1 hypothetical protein COHCIP112018_01350 [Cohnella sp. JJ-181]